MKIAHLLATVLVALSPVVALAHGMDKPGPHGGVIRMPGMFHTEVLDKGDGRFTVYLLDGAFENPVTENSSLKLTFAPATGAPVDGKCTPEADHFTCTVPGFPAKAGGELRLDATREGTTGRTAKYPVPLQVPASKDAGHGADGHGDHGAGH